MLFLVTALLSNLPIQLLKIPFQEWQFPPQLHSQLNCSRGTIY